MKKYLVGAIAVIVVATIIVCLKKRNAENVSINRPDDTIIRLAYVLDMGYTMALPHEMMTFLDTEPPLPADDEMGSRLLTVAFEKVRTTLRTESPRRGWTFGESNTVIALAAQHFGLPEAAGIDLQKNPVESLGIVGKLAERGEQAWGTTVQKIATHPSHGTQPKPIFRIRIEGGIDDEGYLQTTSTGWTGDQAFLNNSTDFLHFCNEATSEQYGKGWINIKVLDVRSIILPKGSVKDDTIVILTDATQLRGGFHDTAIITKANGPLIFQRMPGKNKATIERIEGRFSEPEALIPSRERFAQDLEVVRERVAALNKTAMELYQQGKYADAISYTKELLTILERIPETEQKSIGSTLQFLATLYRKIGDNKSAEPLYKRALTFLENDPGPNHPNTLITVANLAELYKDMRNYKEAVPLFERVLSIWEINPGPIHPDTVAARIRLAETYCSMGDYKSAEAIYKQVLASDEEFRGKEHLDTAKSLSYLGNFYLSRGNYKSAEPLLKRALAIFEKVKGKEHPDTVGALNRLAALYQTMGTTSQRNHD
jgi:tetratricopeptide (TPR) repeat protein